MFIISLGVGSYEWTSTPGGINILTSARWSVIYPAKSYKGKIVVTIFSLPSFKSSSTAVFWQELNIETIKSITKVSTSILLMP